MVTRIKYPDTCYHQKNTNQNHLTPGRKAVNTKDEQWPVLRGGEEGPCHTAGEVCVRTVCGKPSKNSSKYSAITLLALNSQAVSPEGWRPLHACAYCSDVSTSQDTDTQWNFIQLWRKASFYTLQ